MISLCHSLFIFYFLIPNSVFSNSLNLICTNNYINVKSLDVKDMFVVIDSKNKQIELGGLSFYVDQLKKLIQIYLGQLKMLEFILNQMVMFQEL